MPYRCLPFPNTPPPPSPYLSLPCPIPMARIPAAGAVGRSGVQWGRWCRDLRGAAGAPPWGALGALGSGGGRGKGRARGAPADPPTRPCAPHGCNENTVTGTQHAWGGGVAHRDKKGGTRDTGWHPGGGGRCMWHGVPLNPMGRGTLLLGVGGGGEELSPSLQPARLLGTHVLTAARSLRRPTSFLPRFNTSCRLPAPFPEKLRLRVLICIQAPPPTRRAPPPSRPDRTSSPTVYLPATPTCFAYSPRPSPRGFASGTLSFAYRPRPHHLPRFAYSGPAPPSPRPPGGPARRRRRRRTARSP